MTTESVPEGWIKTTLGDTNYFQILGSGIKYFQGTKEYLSTSSVEKDKIVRVEEIITHKDRPSRANMQPVSNSAWFAKMKATVKVLEADKKIIKKNILSTGFCGILSTKLNSRYLKQFLLDEKFNIIKDSKTEGTTQEAINNENTGKIEIIFPKDIKEQEKIAKILQTVDGAIEETKNLIEKHKMIKDGLMTDLFEFREGFEIVSLGKLLQLIRNGTSETQVDHVTDYPVTRIETISAQEIDFNKVGYVEQVGDSFKLHTGDVLISNINSIAHIGKVAIYDDKRILYHGMNLLIFRFNDLIDPQYAYYYLRLQKPWFERMCSQAVNQASINQSTIVTLPFIKPKDKNEQAEIVLRIESVDNSIDEERNHLSKLIKMKQGLMQDLLTGKRRVVA